MFKKIVAKGNIRKSDYLRALVTDTLPGDIPIIISNDGFYKNKKTVLKMNIHQKELVDKIFDTAKPYTLPYRFNIMRSGKLPRRLSLVHPANQLDAVKLYQEYGDLICYYCKKSPASIRSPRKVGSLFFVRGHGSNKNALKGSSIDTVDIENTVSNPASYFSYRGVDRAFKFFNSHDYISLERKYPILHFSDISNCFGSIYTHTLYWAVCDIITAKDNIHARTFSNSFDRLMQVSNYNETNGICIGAEISRIFAEIILSEVDKRTILDLKSNSVVFRRDYEYRRYVDDFYIFSSDERVGKLVIATLSKELSKFNLSINSLKTVKVSRPFITSKSHMIRECNRALNSFFDKFIFQYKYQGLTHFYPGPIYQPAALFRSFLDEIKSSCFNNNSGYENISAYIIGAINSRITALIESHSLCISQSISTIEKCVDSIMLLLEVMYFFYGVDPTIPSSLKVSQSAILSYKFLFENSSEKTTFLIEEIVRWTSQLSNDIISSTSHKENNCVPLEAINIMLVLGVVGRKDFLAHRAIEDFCRLSGVEGYFEIISYLFCIRDDTSFGKLIDKIFNRITELVRGKDKIRIESEAAHLALDTLSCPFIPQDKRVELFNYLRSDVGLPPISKADATLAVEHFEKSPWFVDWKDANLLAMIRKKELSSVY